MINAVPNTIQQSRGQRVVGAAIADEAARKSLLDIIAIFLRVQSGEQMTLGFQRGGV